ncbi:hypothetical protein D791_03705 [Nitrincola nitratireducens]|uniref:Uncharacterized protein n=1 Tax=Nitrincola nitratireducens TaxID=1229521 RepID=W9UQG7_9GAMM|nr:hypothetical protein D791_03705 [Nitrincola nitratireducens]
MNSQIANLEYEGLEELLAKRPESWFWQLIRVSCTQLLI